MVESNNLPLEHKSLLIQQSVWWGLSAFLALIFYIAAVQHGQTLFLDFHGYRHRLSGGALLLWLCYGCYLIGEDHFFQSNTHNHGSLFIYDLVLGLLGITATLTAASDFPHKRVKNAIVGQSGTLAQTAIVTQAEMIEHAFYQGLNLWQAVYLHSMETFYQRSTVVAKDEMENSLLSIGKRLVALLIVTAPWLLRQRFPVHSFSNNWKKKELRHEVSTKDGDVDKKAHNSKTASNVIKQQQHEATLLLYKIKKWQYVFYKHVILHGLNITICLLPHRNPNHDENEDSSRSVAWRIFWISLNAAYVMEFFLQSLVKRRILSQTAMIILNQWLMLVSSVAALQSVLQVVHWPACAASLILNFWNRKHDILNTFLVASTILTVNTFITTST